MPLTYYPGKSLGYHVSWSADVSAMGRRSAAARATASWASVPANGLGARFHCSTRSARVPVERYRRRSIAGRPADGEFGIQREQRGRALGMIALPRPPVATITSVCRRRSPRSPGWNRGTRRVRGYVRRTARPHGCAHSRTAAERIRQMVRPIRDRYRDAEPRRS